MSCTAESTPLWNGGVYTRLVVSVATLRSSRTAMSPRRARGLQHKGKRCVPVSTLLAAQRSGGGKDERRGGYAVFSALGRWLRYRRRYSDHGVLRLPPLHPNSPRRGRTTRAGSRGRRARRAQPGLRRRPRLIQGEGRVRVCGERAPLLPPLRARRLVGERGARGEVARRRVAPVQRVRRPGRAEGIPREGVPPPRPLLLLRRAARRPKRVPAAAAAGTVLLGFWLWRVRFLGPGTRHTQGVTRRGAILGNLDEVICVGGSLSSALALLLSSFREHKSSATGCAARCTGQGKRCEAESYRQ